MEPKTEFINDKLRELYYNPKDPGSYGGVERLLRRVKRFGINRQQVQKFLHKQFSYSIHKPYRRSIPRNKTYVSGIDIQWQADLADFKTLSRKNGGYRYLLCCIDVFSRSGWVVPVKTKSAPELVNAFKGILDKSYPRKPIRIQTDKGKEFCNKDVKSILSKKYNIEHFTTCSDKKAALCERFIRTLKTRIWTYLTAQKTSRYLDVLDNIVQAYNNSFHRSIGMAPNKVCKKYETKIWKRLYGESPNQMTSSINLKPNQKVRISRIKGEFEKGYVPNWSEEDFHVTNVIESMPHTVYKLEDETGEKLKGSWYRKELQPIDTNEYRIEKIIKKRRDKINGQVEFFVKWSGWPTKFNSWIKDSDVINPKSKYGNDSQK